MDHPLEAVLGGGLQESGGGRRVHQTHLATLTGVQAEHRTCMEQGICLLYTSDAADDSSRVALGGHRDGKKKCRLL